MGYSNEFMKRFLTALLLFISAIMAYSGNQPLQRARFTDNWSVGLSLGGYHPMCFPMKYLADCSGWMGIAEVRKQLMPAFAMGVEADIYMRMDREERKDPRTVIGPACYLNISRLIQGYTGMPRFFEVEAMIMPAWGHLYRGTDSEYFPDENFFATKFGADFRFTIGRDREWTFSVRPAMVYDLSVPHGNQYESFDINHADLQLTVGATYHIKGKRQQRHLTFAKPVVDMEEINRLNDIVNYLRSDVAQRDAELDKAKTALDSAENARAQLENRVREIERRKPKTVERTVSVFRTQIPFNAARYSVGQTQMSGIEAVTAFLKEYPKAHVKVTAYVKASEKEFSAILASKRVEAVTNAILLKSGIDSGQIDGEVETTDAQTPAYKLSMVSVEVAER